jgi:hypothetical protein
MERLQQTPSQTVGPFFAYSLTAEQYSYDYNSIINGSLLTMMQQVNAFILQAAFMMEKEIQFLMR